MIINSETERELRTPLRGGDSESHRCHPVTEAQTEPGPLTNRMSVLPITLLRTSLGTPKGNTRARMGYTIGIDSKMLLYQGNLRLLIKHIGVVHEGKKFDCYLSGHEDSVEMCVTKHVK